MSCGPNFRATYTNWRGETRERFLRPLGVRWGVSEWHPTPGLLIRCLDLETREEREFAASGFATTTGDAEGGSLQLSASAPSVLPALDVDEGGAR